MQPQALDPESAGFYGKLPSRGDFIRRGLTRDFLEPWHRAMALALADQEYPLEALWQAAGRVELRFVLGPGCAGAHGWCGVLVPSCDSVGRGFPLACALRLNHVAEAGHMLEPGGLLDHAARLAWHCAGGGVEPDALEPALAQLMAAAAALPRPQIELLGEAALLFEDCPPLAAALALGLEGARSFWWRDGACLFAPGLPLPLGFAGLLAPRRGTGA